MDRVAVMAEKLKHEVVCPVMKQVVKNQTERNTQQQANAIMVTHIYFVMYALILSFEKNLIAST